MTSRKTSRLHLFFKMVLVLITVLWLPGCWDRTEINDIAIVMATAVDKDKDGYKISTLIPLPGNMGGTSGGGGGTGGEKPYYIDSDTGRTPREALSKMQSRMSRKLYFSHRRVILISEELMADEGLSKSFDSIMRIPENRPTTFLAVTKGKASDLLNATPKMERFSAEAIREILHSEETIKKTVKDIGVELSEEGTDAVLPYIEEIKSKGGKESSSEIELTGYALTKNGKLTKVIKGDPAIGLRMLKGEFQVHTETMSTQDGPVSIGIRRGSTRIEPHLEDDEIHFSIQLTFLANITEALDGRNYTNEKNVRQLEKFFENRIREKEVGKAIDLIRQNNGDVVGFGEYLNRKYPDQWNKEWKDNWYELLKNCKFDVTVRVNIDRNGMFDQNVAERRE